MKHPLFWSKPASLGKRFQVDTAGTLTTGIISYYKLEDSTDFWSTNNGTATNVTFSTGKVNNSGTSSVNTGRIEISQSATLHPTQFSISCWFNSTNVATTQEVIACLRDSPRR